MAEVDEDVVADWTLVGTDSDLLGNKAGATRLGFALSLKFFELESRFPDSAAVFSSRVVSYVAEQVSVDGALLHSYDWSGRTATRHRSQIRDAFGFREFTRADEDRLSAWLAGEVFPFEHRESAIREALLDRVRSERIEPPGRVSRLIGAARAAFESSFCANVWERVGEVPRDRLEGLIADGTSGGVRGLMALASTKMPEYPANSCAVLDAAWGGHTEMTTSHHSQRRGRLPAS